MNNKSNDLINVDRRRFLLKSGAGAGCYILGINLSLASASKKPGFISSAYIEISPDNSVIFILPKSEMGQGVLTSLAMLIAEEMEVNIDRVEIKQADYHPKYGNQNTGGSSSVSSNWNILRQAGALTREIFLQTASEEWDINKRDCYVEDGVILNRLNDRKITYGNLIQTANNKKLPDKLTLKSQNEFKVIGKSINRKDSYSKISGRANYGSDIQIKNILSATVIHCPYINGKLIKYNLPKDINIDGEFDIFTLGNDVAIVADSYWITEKIRKNLNIKWDDSHSKNINSDDIKREYLQSLDEVGIVAEEKAKSTKNTLRISSFRIYLPSTISGSCANGAYDMYG